MEHNESIIDSFEMPKNNMGRFVRRVVLKRHGVQEFDLWATTEDDTPWTKPIPFNLTLRKGKGRTSLQCLKRSLIYKCA